jgi:PAS domain S-box-containing protein
MHRVVRPGGEVRVLQGRGVVERDGDGALRLRAVSHDVTDVKEFKTALERLSRQHALILASAGEGIAGVDADRRVTFLNPAAERMLGWSAEELLGRDWHEAFHHTRADGSPYPREECPILEAFQHGEHTHEQGELFWRRDGTGFPVDCFAAPIREGDEVTGGVLIFRDRTEEDEAQQERARFEQRRRQTERLESLGRLAGGVAHDFNNLLAVILSYAVIVEGKLAESDPSRDDIREIRRAAERSASLTQQLLVFSRAEVARREVIDLNRQVRDMEGLLSRMLGEGASLDLSLSDEPALIEVDPSQMGQVLMNLVVNASDALPEGGTVSIETQVGEQMDGVRLRVFDDGEGMAPDVAARAFEPFYTTKSAGQGTGLGLATVYGVVTQSGGRIELSSAVGEGTEVIAQFPHAPPPAHPAAPEPPETERLEGPERTVLLVEDNDVVRALAARILTEAGHRVLEVADPVRALALAEEHQGPIDVLLTDMVLPRLSGSELARRVRSERPETAVVFVSGYPQSGQEARPLLRKPFTPDSLLAAVRDAGGLD